MKEEIIKDISDITFVSVEILSAMLDVNIETEPALDELAIICYLEAIYDIELSNSEISNIRTLSDIITVLEKYTSVRSLS